MDNKKWFHSQFFIPSGCTLIVFYLAGIPLFMLLYESRRSARTVARLLGTKTGIVEL